MNENVARTALSALLVCAAISPARADATGDLQAKVDGALRGAKSYVVTTLYPAQAYSSTLVVVAPDRSRMAVAVEANTTDVVTIGQTSYSSKNGAPFVKSIATPAPASPAPGSPAPSGGGVKVAAMRSDVRSGGVAYGAFDATVPLDGNVALTCTYDKKSYRLVRCANAEVTLTYADYDDPKNVVEAPKNFIDAPAVETPKGTN